MTTRDGDDVATAIQAWRLASERALLPSFLFRPSASASVRQSVKVLAFSSERGATSVRDLNRRMILILELIYALLSVGVVGVIIFHVGNGTARRTALTD